MTPHELLAAARSAEWKIRRDAAAALAHFDTAEAEQALVRLLLDPDNTAPVEAAADALVARGDAFGVAVISKAIAASDDQDDGDHLLWFVARADARTGYGVLVRAEEAACSEDAMVRAGAEEIVAYLKASAA